MPFAPDKTVADRFPEHLEAVLNALGTDPRFVAAEVAVTTGPCWAKTANRRVVGIMNEFTYLAEVDRAQEPSEDLVSMAVRLAGTHVDRSTSATRFLTGSWPRWWPDTSPIESSSQPGF